MTAVLRISDGTTAISLINGEDGFYLNRWRPSIARWKGGGTWQSSPLADGRRLVARQFENAIETFDIKLHDADPDALIHHTQELRRLLEKAAQYWTTDWQNEPVWIEAQASCETNLRYAILHAWQTPEDDNPYSAPFLQPPNAGASMDNWTLIVERGHWLSDEPGTGTCVEIGGTKDGLVPDELYWEPEQSTDDAAAWTGPLFSTVSIVLYFGQLAGLVYDSGVRFRGVTIPQGATITRAWVKFEAGVADAVNNCNVDITGEDVDDAAAFSDRADWDARVQTAASVDWDVIGAWVLAGEYNTPDISTVVQEIVDRDGWESGNDMVIFFHDDSSANGAIRRPASWDHATYDEPRLNVEWFIDGTRGRTETCLEEVYIANKENTAQLTHVYVDNGGIFGNNLLTESLPYDLLPAVPANNDVVYFGVTTAIDDSGPFCSLVFDLATAATYSGAADITWQYWNGAWAALTPIQDNTDADGLATGGPFDTAGVRSVHWEHPSDWVAYDLSGAGGPAVTAFWVRGLCSIPAPPGDAITPPTQQNRHVYSILWPYTETEDEYVGGDLPALLRVKMRNESDGNVGAGGTTALYANRILAGLRSLSRGSDFSMYINISDEQNPTGITVTDNASGSFANDVTAPTGRKITITAPPAAWTYICYVDFSTAIAPQYRGTYHAFMRVDQTGGAAGDISFRLMVEYSYGGTGWTGTGITTETAQVANVAKWELVNFGKIRIPPSDAMTDDDDYEVLITIQAYGNGASDIDIFDLILLPVDECAVDIGYSGTSSFLGVRGTTNSEYLDMDNIAKPKVGLRGVLSRYSDDQRFMGWNVIANNEFIFQHNADQKIHFLNVVEWATDDWRANPCIANSMAAISVERYFSMRGER